MRAEDTEQLLKDYMRNLQDDDTQYDTPKPKSKAKLKPKPKCVEPKVVVDEVERVFSGQDALGWVLASGELGLIIALTLLLMGVI